MAPEYTVGQYVRIGNVKNTDLIGKLAEIVEDSYAQSSSNNNMYSLSSVQRVRVKIIEGKRRGSLISVEKSDISPISLDEIFN